MTTLRRPTRRRLSSSAATVLSCLLLCALLPSLAATATRDPLRPWLDGKPTSLPLLSRRRVSRDAYRYRFGLSSGDAPVVINRRDDTAENDSVGGSSADDVDGEDGLALGIPICSCLLVSPPSDPALVRPYTPISSRHERDSFELLVKHYPDGEMTGRYFKKLRRGDRMVFWQIPKNIKELVSLY